MYIYIYICVNLLFCVVTNSFSVSCGFLQKPAKTASKINVSHLFYTDAIKKNITNILLSCSCTKEPGHFFKCLQQKASSTFLAFFAMLNHAWNLLDAFLPLTFFIFASDSGSMKSSMLVNWHASPGSTSCCDARAFASFSQVHSAS